MEVLWGRPQGNFQSSLRDFSSFESLPRTASWAKFSRPCGTHFSRAHAFVLLPMYGMAEAPYASCSQLSQQDRPSTQIERCT
jgi:hypothetical protein